jgi:hypothetical protein
MKDTLLTAFAIFLFIIIATGICMGALYWMTNSIVGKYVIGGIILFVFCLFIAAPVPSYTSHKHRNKNKPK